MRSSSSKTQQPSAKYAPSCVNNVGQESMSTSTTRVVVLNREAATSANSNNNKSLGIRVVSGKSDNSKATATISGIFVKHIVENSPAGRNGTLKIGDRLLAVNGYDLTTASHEQAVDILRNAESPVQLIIQSIVHDDAAVDNNNNNNNNNNSKTSANPYGYTIESLESKYSKLIESHKGWCFDWIENKTKKRPSF